MAAIYAVSGCRALETNTRDGYDYTEAVQVKPAAASYANRTAALTALLEEHEARRTRRQAALELARLYLDHANPAKDYRRALVHMNLYFELCRDTQPAEDVVNWWAALELLERTTAVAQQVAPLKSTIAKLNLEIERLEAEVGRHKNERVRLNRIQEEIQTENQRLRALIEQLKQLDLQHEAKRNRLIQPLQP